MFYVLAFKPPSPSVPRPQADPSPNLFVSGTVPPPRRQPPGN
jgi:hypothetical protein